jgi:predicted Zn-dependent peptidase
MLNRSQPPVITPLSIAPFPGIITKELSNGLQIHFLPWGIEPILEIKWIFNAGSAHDGQLPLGDFTAKMLKEGTRSYSSDTLADFLDFYGAYLEVTSGMEIASVSLVTLEKHLEKVFPLLDEIIFNPTFPEPEFNLMKERVLQQMLVDEQKTSWHARRIFLSKILGEGHPYGKVAEKEDIRALNIEGIKEFHKNHYRAGNGFLVVSGHFDINKLMLLFESSFGSLKDNEPALKSNAANHRETFLPERIHHTLENKEQTSIRIGHPSIKRNHPDFMPLQLANLVLGGYFGSRLMKNIREEKGYTYGIGSFVSGFLYAGYFGIATDVGKEYVENTLKETLYEMGRLIESGVEFEELETAKNYYLGQMTANRETPFQMGDHLVTALVNQLPLSSLDEEFEKIKYTDQSELMRLYSTYLKPDNLLIVTCGS